MLKEVKKLCTPAFLYFTLSIFSLIMMFIQNFSNTNTFCLGTFDCEIPDTKMVYLIKILYIGFFTWLLNTLCKMGYENISWFLLFLPFIFFFVVLGIFMFLQNNNQLEYINFIAT
tara:strand:- start:528 stop:872 length:345 start_codon:yes stop_codon:yes gene_type:complete